MSANIIQPEMEIINACRSCGQNELTEIIDFGDSPLADRLIKLEQKSAPEYRAPLTLVQCQSCSLVQILETVEPSILFGSDYPYYSSVSPSLMKHFSDSALSIIESKQLNQKSLVMEAASNDGYMLKSFVDKNIPVLGIDPADGPVRKAMERGVNTMHTFFTVELAKQLKNENKQADVFLSNNVLAHVADLNGFVAGVELLLKADGLWVIECPYLLDLVDHLEFDTIYHQHLCYFSITALMPLFERHGLHLNHVERTSIHGGSLRLFVSRTGKQSATLTELLALENKRQVATNVFFDSFVNRITTIKQQLNKLVAEIRNNNKRIIGYGAAAKGTTLLHYMRLGADDLAYIIDKNPHKNGWCMPGNHIDIKSPTHLDENTPDYVLILAWNFANEIIAEQSALLEKGVKFIVPIPSLRVISNNNHEERQFEVAL
jgi:hypothetical protein